MKTVHGKFTSFKDMAIALGKKPSRAKTPKDRNCPICGEKLTFHPDTNVWTCGNPYIRDDVVNGVEVQVFGTCGYFSLD